jgi:hypothetical protein
MQHSPISSASPGPVEEGGFYEDDPVYLGPDVFEGLYFPENIPPYEGGGSTSYSSKYDGEKLNYLIQLGIELPDVIVDPETGSVVDRAGFITLFIVTGTILSVEEIRRRAGMDGEAVLKKILPGITRKLREMRIDPYSDRFFVDTGVRVEDVFREMGFSCNPTQQVSEDEFSMIFNYVLGQFSKKR